MEVGLDFTVTHKVMRMEEPQTDQVEVGHITTWVVRGTVLVATVETVRNRLPIILVVAEVEQVQTELTLVQPLEVAEEMVFKTA